MLKKYLPIFLCLIAICLLNACSRQNIETSEEEPKKDETTLKTDTPDEVADEISDANKINPNDDPVKEDLQESVTDQKLHTPKKGSEERTAILEALRIPVEKELKQEIVFAPSEFNVLGNWAFVGGEPLAKSGGKPNYKGTIYEQDVKDGLFDDNFFALLKKTGNQWKVVTYALGCTDVCYAIWWEEYKVPKEIFYRLDSR